MHPHYTPALRPVCGTFQKTGFRLRLIVCACLPAWLAWLLLLLLACTSCCCCFVGLLGFFFVVVFKLYLLCLCCAFDFVTHFLCWFRCRCDVAVAVAAAAMWLLILMLFFSLMEFMLLCPFRQRTLCSLLVCSVAATRFFECINAHTLLLLLFLLSALLLLLLAALFFFNSWEFGSFFVTLVKGKGQVCWNNEITALYRKFSFALFLLLFIQCLLFIAFTWRQRT